MRIRQTAHRLGQLKDEGTELLLLERLLEESTVVDFFG